MDSLAFSLSFSITELTLRPRVGLAFFGYFVSAAMTYIGYIIYLKKRIEPLSRSGRMVPEDRLEIGLIGACIIPISTFIFGWTSRESVHWIVPVIVSPSASSERGFDPDD
jgi:hypothetical protein